MSESIIQTSKMEEIARDIQYRFYMNRNYSYLDLKDALQHESWPFDIEHVENPLESWTYSIIVNTINKYMITELPNYVHIEIEESIIIANAIIYVSDIILIENDSNDLLIKKEILHLIDTIIISDIVDNYEVYNEDEQLSRLKSFAGYYLKYRDVVPLSLILSTCGIIVGEEKRIPC